MMYRHWLQILAIAIPVFFLGGCGDADMQDGTPANTETVATSGASSADSEGLANDSSIDATQAFYAFAEEVFEERLMDSPQYLTALGRSERYDEWDDVSDEAVARGLERNRRHLTELLDTFDPEDLSQSARTSFLILKLDLEDRIERAGFYRDSYPVNHRSSPASALNVFLINRHSVNNVEDAEAYIARLQGIEGVLTDTAEVLRDRVEYGLHAPAFMYPDIITETTALAALATPDRVGDHPAMIDFTAKVEALDASAAERDQLLERARTALLGPVARGYQIYLAALLDANAETTTDDGIWRHPRGAEDYASRIRTRLGNHIDPDVIHDFGLAEVARIQGEMHEVMATVGFEGTLQDFFSYMNEAEEFVYPNTEEGRARHMTDMLAAVERVREVAPQYFNLMPSAELEIRRVEPFREQNAGRAFYSRPAPDGSRPGIFYANQADMDQWQTWHVDTLVFHEAIPGHHFQIAYAQELEGVPSFQQYGFESAFSEGWALYTERLGAELGLLSDPYADFGRLNAELFRAVRLVVDTGLHHKRWSRQEAAQYMTENTPMHPDFIDEEVRRYLVRPTQALGYKWGMTEFLRLREWAREELGDDFDIRAFHDAAIGSGAVPLPVLRELVSRYVTGAGGSAETLDAFMERAETEAMTESQRLNAFFEEVYEAELMRSPLVLTVRGRKERYGEWDDLSDDAQLEEATIAQQELDRLHTEFDFGALDEVAQVSYRIFEYRNERRIESTNFNRRFYPLHQMFGFHTRAPQALIQYHSVGSVADAEAYISRIEGLEAAMGQLADVIRDRTAFGVLPPAFTYPLVLESVEATVTGAPFDGGEPSPLWADFTAKIEALDTTEDERARLLADAETAFTGPMRRGYDDLIAAINEAIPRATHDDGVWQVPKGEAFYAQRVSYYTQGEMTPDEIHEWGLRDVARIHEEMHTIMAEVGFDGTLQEFFTWLTESPENYYPDTDEGREQFLTDARTMTDQVMARTPEFFNLLPEAPMEVRRIEPYRESQGTIAHYSRPAPDGSRPGIYYANLRSMDMWPRHTMEAITYHEGVPGHHFQIALMQELEGLPTFRTAGSSGNTAYVEGWGLYSELVAYEMGFYEDPYSNFGRLATVLWRAVRLVVDTGMHHKRWTRDEAYDYMMTNTPLGEETVRREINRYIVWPGQALAYRAGRQKILELRAAAQEALGEDFDIRTFHDAVLGAGAVPLPVLEEIVRSYIEDELANSE